MIAQEHFLSTTKRFIKEFGSGHRIAGVIVLVIVATFGAMQWTRSGGSAVAPDSCATAQSQTAEEKRTC